MKCEKKTGRATRQRHTKEECLTRAPVLSCAPLSACSAGYTNSARHVRRQAQYMLSTRTIFVVIGAHNPRLSPPIYSSQDPLLMRMRSTRVQSTTGSPKLGRKHWSFSGLGKLWNCLFVLVLLLLFFLSLFLMSYNRGATGIQSRVFCFYGESNLRCPITDRLMKKPREFLWAPGNGFNFPTFLGCVFTIPDSFCAGTKTIP